MEWVKTNWDTILAVVGFAIAVWKAWKNGNLVDFLVKRVEPLTTPADKTAIQAAATEAGVEDLLHKFVKSNGLSSK